MRIYHPDYIKLVLEAYKKKRANNELSVLLTQSTPANIRRECEHIYQERYDKKDEPVLRAFFGPAEQGRRFLAVIQDFEADRFRPLDGYLKGDGEKGISGKSLELFAWLIDFKHRPYAFDKDFSLSEEEKLLIGESNNKSEKTEKVETEPLTNGSRIMGISPLAGEEGKAIDETQSEVEKPKTERGSDGLEIMGTTPATHEERTAIEETGKTETGLASGDLEIMGTTIPQMGSQQMTLVQTKSAAEKTGAELLVDKGFQEEKEKMGDILKNGLDKIPVSSEDLPRLIKFPSESTAKRKSKRAIIILLMLILCSVGIYAIWPQQTGCMYWTGDHYEQVPCNEKGKGILFPLDEDKMKGFKRILNKDTITEKSINVVYYISNGGLEFYTTGGNHPIYTTRQLKKLSRYMFEKHLRKNPSLTGDSLTP